MKYLIVDKEGFELPILFPDFIQHATVLPKGCKPVSAGFWSLAPGEGEGAYSVEVSGRSESLNLGCRPIKDSNLILAALSGDDNSVAFISVMTEEPQAQSL